MDTEVFDILPRCTVKVLYSDNKSFGTGTLVAPGIVVVAGYVLRSLNHDEARMEWEGHTYLAKVIASSSKSSPVLLRIETPPSHPCVYCDDTITPGDVLFSYGYSDVSPGGDSYRLTFEGFTNNPRLLKLAGGQVGLGMGGAPLLNERTKGVCGIVLHTRDRVSLLGEKGLPVRAIYDLQPDVENENLRYHQVHPEWLDMIRVHREHNQEIRVGGTRLFISVGYRKLLDPIEDFLTDAEKKGKEYDKNVFIMMRFQAGNSYLRTIDETIRESFGKRGLHCHRADDRTYPKDRNLWDNVCTYMFGCAYGIAVFEDIIKNEFNSNVALEYGFMRAMGKPVLLLKEKRMEPRADILGTLWEEFDMLDIIGTIGSSIERWLNDLGIPSSTQQ